MWRKAIGGRVSSKQDLNLVWLVETARPRKTTCTFSCQLLLSSRNEWQFLETFDENADDEIVEGEVELKNVVIIFDRVLRLPDGNDDGEVEDDGDDGEAHVSHHQDTPHVQTSWEAHPDKREMICFEDLEEYLGIRKPLEKSRNYVFPLMFLIDSKIIIQPLPSQPNMVVIGIIFHDINRC